MRTALALLLCLLALPGSASAEAALEDELFSGAALVTVADADGVEAPANDLIATDTVVIGGRFSITANLTFDLSAQDGADAVTSGLAGLATRLFIDARPSSDLRVFVEGDASYATETGLQVGLREMFADIDVCDAVFVRVGKQTINWGVGMFFSPANLVNEGRVDPENPEEEATGPVAVKGQWPLGASNLTGYLILEDIGADAGVAAAARYESVADDVEWTVGGLYGVDAPWAVMATATGAVDDTTLFAEAVVQGNSDKVFVVADAGSPAGYRATVSDGVFVSGTLGGRYRHVADDDTFSIAAAAQYYFNGLAYADPTLFSDDPRALAFAWAQVAQGAMSPSDLQARGQHNAAVSLSIGDRDDARVTSSLSWLASLSDGSGLLSAGVRYEGIEFVSVGLGYRFGYGPEGAEYAVDGPSHTLSLSVKVSGSF